MKKLVRTGVTGVLLVALLLSGCGRYTDVDERLTPDDTEKLNVVTTLFPYYDFVRQVAGDKVELTMVIPAGMDSHSFEPTPADMLMIQNADVLVTNGGHMEQWLTKVLEAIDTSRMTVVSMMDYVDIVEEKYVEGMEDADHQEHDHDHPDSEKEDHDHHGHEEDDGKQIKIEYDEHIWTSPVKAMQIVNIISETLIQADPEQANLYQANTDAYLSKLTGLHEQFLDVVKNEKRNMIIVADKFPFRYLADEYGLNYRAAFSGCSTDTEPSAQTIAYLADKIKEDRIPVVYYLELSSQRVSGIIAEETGVKPLLLHSCHNVTRSQFDDGITYLELMENNVENLRKGLEE